MDDKPKLTICSEQYDRNMYNDKLRKFNNSLEAEHIYCDDCITNVKDSINDTLRFWTFELCDECKNIEEEVDTVDKIEE